jgi:hypothetical protein
MSENVHIRNQNVRAKKSDTVFWTLWRFGHRCLGHFNFMHFGFGLFDLAPSLIWLLQSMKVELLLHTNSDINIKRVSLLYYFYFKINFRSFPTGTLLQWISVFYFQKSKKCKTAIKSFHFFSSSSIEKKSKTKGGGKNWDLLTKLSYPANICWLVFFSYEVVFDIYKAFFRRM